MALIDIINKWAIQPEDPNAIPPELLDAVSHESKPVAQPVEAKPSVEQRFTDSDADRKMASRAELETLLKSFDDASSRQRRGNVAAGLSEAGMEFGHAFGGQPVDKNWTQGMRDRAGQEKKDVLDKNKLSLEANKESRDEGDYAQKQMVNIQKMDETGLDIDKKGMGNEQERGLMDKSSPASQAAREFLRESGIPVDDNADARSIVTLFPAAKARIDQIDAVAQRKFTEGENTKNRDMNISEGQKDRGSANWRNTQDNQTGIIKQGMAQNSREYIAGMKPDQQMNIRMQRRVPGFKMIDGDKGFVPSERNHSEASSLSESWEALAPLMQKTLNLLEQDPRTIGWTDKWNVLKSNFGSIYQGKNKVNGNGVMNFGDWENLYQELGDPSSMMQWTNQGAKTRLRTALENGNKQYIAKMRQNDYEPGEENIEGLKSAARGMSGAGKAGPTMSPSPDALNQMAQSAGLGNIGLKGNPSNTPQVQQSTGHGDVVKSTKSFRKYADGFIERIQ